MFGELIQPGVIESIEAKRQQGASYELTGALNDRHTQQQLLLICQKSGE
jgi:hypothetical protein